MENDACGSPELDELVHGLFEAGAEMMRLRPHPDVSAGVRGLPAVMRALSLAEGPLSPGDIARASRLSDARVANMLRVLEERGLVERRHAPGDRRRVEVLITEAGRAQAHERAEEMERVARAFLTELGMEDARDLVRILHRVNEVMAKHRDDKGCAACAGAIEDEGTCA